MVEGTEKRRNQLFELGRVMRWILLGGKILKGEEELQRKGVEAHTIYKRNKVSKKKIKGQGLS